MVTNIKNYVISFRTRNNNKKWTKAGEYSEKKNKSVRAENLTSTMEIFRYATSSAAPQKLFQMSKS